MAEGVMLYIDNDLMEAVRARAFRQRKTNSEVVREILRAQLSVAPDEIVYDRWYGDITRYVIGRAKDRWFFAWSDSGYFAPEEGVLMENVELADRGITWHPNLESAIQAAKNCFAAQQETSDDELWQELIDDLPDVEV